MNVAFFCRGEEEGAVREARPGGEVKGAPLRGEEKEGRRAGGKMKGYLMLKLREDVSEDSEAGGHEDR